MELVILTLVGLAVVTLSFLVLRDFWRKYLQRKRTRLIDNYTFPVTIQKKLLETYPHLSEQQVALVMKGLKEYFQVCNLAGKRMVAMPSQAVDVVWHEFILFTRQYEKFCKDSLGRFLHHTPAEAMKSQTVAQEGIKTAWRLACVREDIPPKRAYRLPLLFALDAQLEIPDGFHYSLNCRNSSNGNDPVADHYCAAHIGCGSGCAGGSDSDSGSSGCVGGDSSGCGGGD